MTILTTFVPKSLFALNRWSVTPQIEVCGLMQAERRYEFFKLDLIDLKVAYWIQEKHPNALYPFLYFIALEYRMKSVFLDIDKLYIELVNELGQSIMCKNA